MTNPVIGTYGHGTENDFVLVYDPENSFTISEAQISAICNRSTGIGADGFIRITKADGKWFMDYRNADGSIAEMCGNGIRVMAKYLVTRDHPARRNLSPLILVPESNICVFLARMISQ